MCENNVMDQFRLVYRVRCSLPLKRILQKCRVVGKAQFSSL
jgi:hypothetical protein